MEQAAESDTLPLTEPHQRWQRGLLIAAIISGFGLRILILLNSTGSIDAMLWERFARMINEQGLYDTYRFDAWMNHPPLSALFAAMVKRVADAADLSFPMLYKVPQVLADAVSALLLYDIYRRRHSHWSVRSGLSAAALFAWNLDAVLLSAFHCNTDSLYSMLSLAAIWLADTRRKPLLAGLALGAALNVKLLPAMLIAPLVLMSGSLREVVWIMLGMAPMSLPFLWLWYELGWRFRQRVLQYSPSGGWGFTELLYQLRTHPLLTKYGWTVLDRYQALARFIVLIGAAIPALLMLEKKQRDRYRAAALAAAVFVVVAPSFAIQYAAIVGVLLLAYDLTAGTIWGILAGLRALSLYLFLWTGELPLSAQYGLGVTGPHTYFAALCWGWAIVWLTQQYRRAAPPKTAVNP